MKALEVLSIKPDVEPPDTLPGYSGLPPREAQVLRNSHVLIMSLLRNSNGSSERPIPAYVDTLDVRFKPVISGEGREARFVDPHVTFLTAIYNTVLAVHTGEINIGGAGNPTGDISSRVATGLTGVLELVNLMVRGGLNWSSLRLIQLRANNNLHSVQVQRENSEQGHELGEATYDLRRQRLGVHYHQRHPGSSVSSGFSDQSLHAGAISFIDWLRSEGDTTDSAREAVIRVELFVNPVFWRKAGGKKDTLVYDKQGENLMGEKLPGIVIACGSIEAARMWQSTLVTQLSLNKPLFPPLTRR